MSTSLRISPELQARIASVSERAGKSPHAFMLEALEQETARAERRARLIDDALEAEREALASGKGFPAEEVHAAMEARVRGSRRRLEAKRWRE